MPYTPNNPYIPGDPYSYDLKWIVEQINYAISLYEPLHEEFTDLGREFEDLHDYVMDYFANLDVSEEIREKLDDMAEDGSLAAIVEPLLNELATGITDELAVLNARMDTFTRLPDGSTAGDAELEDIRIGYNGVSYNAAGTAVRTQISDLAALNAANASPQLYTGTNKTQGGITYSWIGNKCMISGTVSGLSFANLDNTGINQIPSHLTAGERYYIEIENSEVPEVSARVFAYNDGTQIDVQTFRSSGYYTIPTTATGLIIRLETAAAFAGRTISGTVSINVLNMPTTKDLKSTLDKLNYIPWASTSNINAANIQAALDNYGVALLGPYDYEIDTPIIMPVGSSIVGMGKATTISYLKASGAALSMSENCTIKDLTISGATADIDITGDSVANKSGIQITRRTSGSVITNVYRCVIENVYIHRFTGFGIRCLDTDAYAIAKALISNVVVENCVAGISLSNVAEYFRVVNSCFDLCRTGCVNHSGNNNFVNCSFSRCINAGVNLVAGANNGHGTYSGCTFNHNQNDGIIIGTLSSGEIFTGCQIFYSNITVNNSGGIRFVGCNVGRDVDITLNDNALVAFDACCFGLYDVNVYDNNNTKVVFNNCYRTDGTDFNPV